MYKDNEHNEPTTQWRWQTAASLCECVFVAFHLENNKFYPRIHGKILFCCCDILLNIRLTYVLFAYPILYLFQNRGNLDEWKSFPLCCHKSWSILDYLKPVYIFPSTTTLAKYWNLKKNPFLLHEFPEFT